MKVDLQQSDCSMISPNSEAFFFTKPMCGRWSLGRLRTIFMFLNWRMARVFSRWITSQAKLDRYHWIDCSRFEIEIVM